MTESEIEIFINCIKHYFSKRSEESVIVETPYLTENINKILSDYTGIINISGSYSGKIYFTAPDSFLKQLILAHNQHEFSDALFRDAIGEITNTLSGNARKALGGQFVISVPSVAREATRDATFDAVAHSYVVPLHWFDQKASMVVSLNKN